MVLYAKHGRLLSIIFFSKFEFEKKNYMDETKLISLIQNAVRAEVAPINTEIASIRAEISNYEKLKEEYAECIEKNVQLRADLNKVQASYILLFEENKQHVEKIHEYKLIEENSFKKGEYFENHYLQPHLEDFFKCVPNTTISNLRNIPHSGDRIVNTNGMKILFDSKNYSGQPKIRSEDVCKLIRDALEQDADSAILVQNSMPAYAGNFLEMKDDPNSIMPPGFDKEMVIICTPENLPKAIHTVLLRYKGKCVETCSDASSELVHKMVNVVESCMEFSMPFFNNFTLDTFTAFQKEWFRRLIDLKRECQLVTQCDSNLKNLKTKVLENLHIQEKKGKESKSLFMPNSKSRKRSRTEMSTENEEFYGS